MSNLFVSGLSNVIKFSVRYSSITYKDIKKDILYLDVSCLLDFRWNKTKNWGIEIGVKNLKTVRIRPNLAQLGFKALCNFKINFTYRQKWWGAPCSHNLPLVLSRFLWKFCFWLGRGLLRTIRNIFYYA